MSDVRFDRHIQPNDLKRLFIRAARARRLDLDMVDFRPPALGLSRWAFMSVRYGGGTGGGGCAGGVATVSLIPRLRSLRRGAWKLWILICDGLCKFAMVFWLLDAGLWLI
ncbi:hypothetical protein FIBSPDRAFT_287436 [Athelia psychrophila]|uniref:Uncharacterized protein n=1 Tax=Athelia psychrophila TaxID=1759441 RepID=A0A167XN97_9AGAM|nr:hypothetical protein FIBSPDRAFT_287436 [Fibularhizoctonia sp. CBS 109695]